MHRRHGDDATREGRARPPPARPGTRWCRRCPGKARPPTTGPGAVLPAQGAVNARLRTAIEQPIAVALVSFVVAALTISMVLAALLITGRTSRPRLPAATMPWWGACAAGYATGTFLLIPAIGAAVTVALTVTGQQLASAAIDSRGWLQLPRRPFTARRGTGLVLLIAGALLIHLL